MYRIYREEDGVQLTNVIVEDWEEAQRLYKNYYKQYIKKGYFIRIKVSDNEYRLSDDERTARLRIALNK